MMSQDSQPTEVPSRVWLITGTSSGFGKRIAKVALEKGDRVIATARSLEKLAELEAELSPEHRHRFRKAILDVTEGEDAIKQRIDAMAAFWGEIDILINNAGYGLPGLMEEGGSKQLRRQFETNVFGVMDVTAATLPHLRASKDACIIVIGSRSAWTAEVTGIGPYASSKAAVHALTENISTEVAPFNIKVCLVQPGGFRTEGIYSQPYFNQNPIPAYDALREASIKRFAGVPGSEKGDPDKAAIAIVDVVRGEGVAKGRPWPPYLVLGEDAEVNVRNKCAKVLKVLDEWVDVARGVSFDPPQDGHHK